MLTGSTACRSGSVLNETLLHFTPVVSIPKMSAKDTSFTLTNAEAAGETARVPVPRGTHITISTPALHLNCTPPPAAAFVNRFN